MAVGRAGFARAPGPAIAAVVGLAYLAIAQYTIWLNDPVNAGAGYWPAAGVTLAALLVLPVPRWGWVVGAVVVAEIGGDALHGYPLIPSLWWAAANAAEPVVAAGVLRRYAAGGRLAPVRDLVWFLAVGVVLGPFLGAVIGSIGTAAEYRMSQLDVLFKWWVGDGLGVLVVAPLLLCFREPPMPGRSRREVVALPSLVGVGALLAFRNWDPEWDAVLPYGVLPLMMWVSVRLGVRGAAAAGFAVAQVASLATGLGYGPFTMADAPDFHAVTVLQVFLGSALTAALVTATLVTDALERTASFERQRRVADVLQLAVLPDHLPEVEGLELAARYEACDDDPAIHVGGDWYDVFDLGDGAVGLCVGDVVGHDLHAAASMGQVRNGLRSLLFELHDPAEVLSALDRQLAAAGGALATVVCAVYRDGELSWTNAGHPPLLLVSAGGEARYLREKPAPLLGLGIGQKVYAVYRTTLAPGDTLVAFTDGLIEHRRWSLDDAFDHLESLAASAASAGPEDVCDRLVSGGLGGRDREDDTCVLVLKRTERASGSDAFCT